MNSPSEGSTRSDSKLRILANSPLGIISIFASLAESFGLYTISQLTPDDQSVFIWFLMGFPTLLVILFFWTLNNNSASLYAPSDYRNEGNYLKALDKNRGASNQSFTTRSLTNEEILASFRNQPD